MNKLSSLASGAPDLEIEFRELMRRPEMIAFLDGEVFDGIWLRDPARPDRIWRSPAFLKLLGLKPGASSDEMILTDGEVSSAMPLDGVVQYETADGSSISVRAQETTIEQDGVQPRMLGVQRRLVRSKEAPVDAVLSDLVQNAGYSMVLWSPERGVLRWNAGAASLFGIDADAATGGDPNILTQADYPSGWAMVMRQLQAVKYWEGDVQRCRADGERQVTASRLEYLDTEETGPIILQIDRDVTILRESDTNRSLISRELNHRVKNLFSVIQGLVGMSARHETDVRVFGDKIIARIKALATAHLLGMDDDSAGTVGNYLNLQSLVSVILNPYWAIVEGSSCEGPPVNLPKRVINPLALILHELATNAIKHGAWAPESGGRVRIDWRMLPPAEDRNKVEITWRETSEGTKMPPETLQRAETTLGFGSKLIDMSSAQLDATLTRNWTDEGLVIKLTFDISEAAR